MSTPKGHFTRKQWENARSHTNDSKIRKQNNFGAKYLKEKNIAEKWYFFFKTLEK